MKKAIWGIFVFFSLGVGIYPVLYFLIDMSGGFLSSKPEELFQNSVWQYAFYLHIIFGGISLLSGWSQFSRQTRTRYVRVHRLLGKIYLISCLISGICGLYMAFYATGGWISAFGFGFLAIFWIFTTSKAYLLIRVRKIDEHKNWMIRSYALTFAAVTLRIWLPLMQVAAFDFITAYQIVSWVCWVPNLIFAEQLIRKANSDRLLMIRSTDKPL